MNTGGSVAYVDERYVFPERETDPEQETPCNPVRDLCPECRAAPDRPHHPECTMRDEPLPDLLPIQVPYQVQEWCFESLADASLLTIADLLDREDEILELARERFRAGYSRYGSRMFGWTAEERLRNVLEELADAVVYLTSGPIE